MDSPPARILPVSTKKLSTRAAHARLDTFLADFEERSSPLKGGDNAVTAQLQKLASALREERHREKQNAAR